MGAGLTVAEGVDVAWLRPALVGSTACVAALAACGDDGRPSVPADALGDDAITVGSFDFPESVLLAELYSQALEENGFRVERALGLGPREFVGPALHAGLIELVPDYGGTAVAFFSAGAVAPNSDPASNHRALEDVVAGSTITALDAAPAENVNTFVVSEDTARRYGLTTLSDLTPVAPELVLGGPPECATRQLCQVGLREVYGLKFADFVALEAGGPVTHQAISDGYVDVALLFSTDPELVDYVELTDDRHLQPAENITPLVHAAIVERWGAEVIDAIDAVSHELDTDSLRQLNTLDAATPGVDDVAEIAAAWLQAKGLA
ncbi:MAG: glycine/betaine transporter substrate-binding protein [Desertimonas sp.]|nr:glycine/betaine transporter substrate-binding protein [Desertimonas sp.]